VTVGISWAVSIALKSILAFLAPSRLFRRWIIFCLVGSLASWYVGFAYPEWYPALWSAKAVSLCLFNAVLVSDACERIGAKLNAGRYLLCATASLLCYSVFTREPRWPESSLEAVFSITALSSSFLAMVLIISIGRYRADFWWRHAAILFLYLFFDSLLTYPASHYAERIGIGTGIATSLCYSLWICNWFTSEPGRKALQKYNAFARFILHRLRSDARA
jgi:hypothetical protein